jgi:hypothetical protein
MLEMRIRIKNTVEAKRALIKANVPSFVVDGISGKILDADTDLNIEFNWLGQQTTWNLPSECVEIVVNKNK